MALIDDRKKIAQFDDQETSAQIVLLGENFKYKNGELVSGNVEQVQFCTVQGEAFATVTNFKLAVSKINDILLSDFGGADLISKLFQHDDEMVGNGRANMLVGEAGNDILRGKGGRDTLVGNIGNDTMSGGSGNDTFQFFGGEGKDVITDFNVGDDVNFDLIFVRDSSISFGKTTENELKLKFDDGASVTLEGVDFSERNDVHIDAVL